MPKLPKSPKSQIARIMQLAWHALVIGMRACFAIA